jgi:hypothetical protein
LALVSEAKPLSQIMVKIGKVHKTKASIMERAFSEFPLLRAKT